MRALPESLGQCKLLEGLCVPPAAPFAAMPALRCCACAAAPGAGLRHAALDVAAALQVLRPGRAWLAPASDRRAVGGEGGRSRPVARRSASNTELAALPAAAEWPSLKEL